MPLAPWESQVLPPKLCGERVKLSDVSHQSFELGAGLFHHFHSTRQCRRWIGRRFRTEMHFSPRCEGWLPGRGSGKRDGIGSKMGGRSVRVSTGLETIYRFFIYVTTMAYPSGSSQDKQALAAAARFDPPWQKASRSTVWSALSPWPMSNLSAIGRSRRIHGKIKVSAVSARWCRCRRFLDDSAIELGPKWAWP